MGFSVEKIAEAVKVSANVIKQWLDGNGRTMAK
jgi:transposase